jgi:hypothetical protein
MTHPMHSEHCKCECDLLAEKIRKIIAPCQPSLLVMMLNDALDGVCKCPLELLYKGDHYGYCGSL